MLDQNVQNLNSPILPSVVTFTGEELHLQMQGVSVMLGGGRSSQQMCWHRLSRSENLANAKSESAWLL
jgi:hypothetical protein